MSEPLKSLLALIERSQKNKGAKGSKKREVLQHFDLILKAEQSGARYPEIVEALNEDGINIKLPYFKTLMAEEKKERGIIGKKSSKPVELKQVSKGVTFIPEPKKEKSSNEITPEQEALKAEVDKIQKSSMNLAEKREALAKLTEHLKDLNPLTGR